MVFRPHVPGFGQMRQHEREGLLAWCECRNPPGQKALTSISIYRPCPASANLVVSRSAECHHGEGGGGGTTGGRSLQVMVFGSSHGASQGPVMPPPVLPPRSVSENSEPAGVKWKDPQLLTPTAPTLRASTFSKDAAPAVRALGRDNLLVDRAWAGDHPDVDASEIRAAFGDVFDQATLFHGVSPARSRFRPDASA